MFCKNCGKELDDNAVICPNCGVPTDKLYAQQPLSEPKKINGIGIAGFVVGLLGLLGGNYLFLIPGIIGLILSIVGVVHMKKCNSANGLAVAGLIVGIVSFIFWLLIWILAIDMIMDGSYPLY